MDALKELEGVGQLLSLQRHHDEIYTPPPVQQQPAGPHQTGRKLVLS